MAVPQLQVGLPARFPELLSVGHLSQVAVGHAAPQPGIGSVAPGVSFAVGAMAGAKRMDSRRCSRPPTQHGR